MGDTAAAPPDDNLTLAVDIVSAYVSNNSVPLSGLPELIASVHASVIALRLGKAADAGGPTRATSAQIKRSISHDAVISFEDGQPYKTLRRHLGLRGLTPEAYRAKWGLPGDYPMVSPAYSAQRSELAKSLGLGQQRRTYSAKAEAPVEAAPEKSRRTGRPRKAAEPAEA